MYFSLKHALYALAYFNMYNILRKLLHFQTHNVLNYPKPSHPKCLKTKPLIS